ncbi:hypothetical protein FXO37_13152 [Capsicum annuum]|nr:hypothetical protein FXO37_13152 [Capsicum annuum]
MFQWRPYAIDTMKNRGINKFYKEREKYVTVEEVNRLAYEHQVWEKEACTVRSGSSLSCVFQGYETKAVESLFYDEDDYLMVSEFLRRRRLLKEGITVPDNQELLPSTHNQSSSALNDGARTPTEREALMKSKPLKETLETLNVKSKELDGDNAYVVSQMVQLKSKDNNDKGFCKLNLPDSLELARAIISLPLPSYSTTSLNFRIWKAAVVALDAVALSMDSDVKVLGPPILNPERLSVDDVEGTDEELLCKLLWREEGWNW